MRLPRPSAALMDTGPAAERRHDWLALAALGLMVGLAARGHFAAPHPDFLELVDCGHAILQGEWPPTLKRAPLYPVLVVGLAKLLPTAVPERTAAEWLNVLSLMACGVLVYELGRQWFGSPSRWAAAWFLLLPIGVYCTAHLIVEPLLTVLVLLTLGLVARGSSWAYAAAACATMTRYDAAGLIVGVAVVDMLRGCPRRTVLVRAAGAVAPLVFWLVLTALSWTTRGADHYVAQMIARPTLDPLYALVVTFRVTFGPELARVPTWFDALESPMRWTLMVAPPLLAAAGLIVTCRQRNPVTMAGGVAFAAYALVHALFPFQFDRFGYPFAGLLILWVGAGLHLTHARAAAMLRSTRLLGAGLLGVGVLVTAALAAVMWSRSVALADSATLFGRLVLPVFAALILVWLAPPLRTRCGGAPLVLLIVFGFVAVQQAARAAERLGGGHDLAGHIAAACWVRDQLPPDARVISAQPGLLRLYAGREQPGRFVGFADIVAPTWREIVAECRRRDIDYIIWHPGLWQEHGPYYGRRWRLSRFDLLGGEAPPEVELVYRTTGTSGPGSAVFRVLPAAAE